MIKYWILKTDFLDTGYQQLHKKLECVKLNILPPLEILYIVIPLPTVNNKVIKKKCLWAKIIKYHNQWCKITVTYIFSNLRW